MRTRLALLALVVLLVAALLRLGGGDGGGRRVPAREGATATGTKGNGESGSRVGDGPGAVRVERDEGAADALALEVVDEAGAPVSGEVVLWRLGRDRDERVGRFTAPASRALAEGHYRAVCLAARADAPDPPAFRVSGHTSVRLVAPRPPSRALFLEVYDSRGRPVGRGRLSDRGRTTVHAEPRPAWLRTDAADGEREVVQSRAFEPRRREDGVAAAGPRGYELGTLPGDSKGRRVGIHATFSIPGHSRVLVRAGAEAKAPGPLKGVVVPLEALLGLVRVPEGIDLSAIGIEAYCFAEPGVAWDRVPINVGVDVPGYRHLRFEYVVARPPRQPFDPPTEPTRPPR